MVAAGTVRASGRMVSAATAATATAAVDMLHAARFAGEIILRNAQVKAAGCIRSGAVLQAGVAQFPPPQEVDNQAQRDCRKTGNGQKMQEFIHALFRRCFGDASIDFRISIFRFIIMVVPFAQYISACI